MQPTEIMVGLGSSTPASQAPDTKRLANVGSRTYVLRRRGHTLHRPGHKIWTRMLLEPGIKLLREASESQREWCEFGSLFSDLQGSCDESFVP